MRSKTSAGLLMYRIRDGRLEVFLAHPGGPFLARREFDCWSIPKGEIEPGEEQLRTAIREFKEETGVEVDPRSDFIELGSIRQKGGKTVHAWGVAGEGGDLRPGQRGYFRLEWPPHSGRMQEFPEVDRAEFFALEEARRRIKASQIPLVDRLVAALKAQGRL
jgi:predicted NUDIX family NTP pyrophosphohydrolase